MIPTLPTRRLTLGPFTQEDAPDVQKMAGAAEIARFTSNIPHPYPEGAAAKWIARHLSDFLENEQVVFAIRQTDGPLLGAIGLILNLEHQRAEMGYWIGVPFWGHGYCTEAAARVVDYGFKELGLHKIHAHHLGSNPASGRVMQKIGMTQEGCLRDHMLKDGIFQDFVAWSILRDEFFAID